LQQIHAEHDLLLDERHHRDEELVVRGARNREVEREVILRADTLRFDHAFQFVPRRLDRGDVALVGLAGGERGGARLGDDAKFVAAADVGQRFERRETAHVRVGAAADGRSRAAPRHDDAVGPQAR
jgi:uncharacterized protein YciU (UPF0263 family)